MAGHCYDRCFRREAQTGVSQLTAELMRCPVDRTRIRRWDRTIASVADRLVAAFGTPCLGNFSDPVEEIFYIMLSARTTDSQYRRTYFALRARFPTLAALTKARPAQIVPCIVGGGLANKRAAHARGLARTLLRLGNDPSSYLRSLTPADAFEFLTALPGMGPKSALCVMMYSLGHDVFTVDSNVQRVAARMGIISAGLKHYRAQQQLPPVVPPGRSKELHVGMVLLGRQVCLPHGPKCGACPIRQLCSTGRERAGGLP